MYKKRDTIEYNAQLGTWIFNLPKAFKGVESHSGIQIIIDSGHPTGEIGDFFTNNDKNGLNNPTITIRGYDDMTGWVSSIKYSVPQLLEALNKILPSDAIEKKTVVATINDLIKK